ncbi:unnamed protein product, partial [Prorocentrum cordatum]
MHSDQGVLPTWPRGLESTDRSIILLLLHRRPGAEDVDDVEAERCQEVQAPDEPDAAPAPGAAPPRRAGAPGAGGALGGALGALLRASVGGAPGGSLPAEGSLAYVEFPCGGHAGGARAEDVFEAGAAAEGAAVACCGVRHFDADVEEGEDAQGGRRARAAEPQAGPERHGRPRVGQLGGHGGPHRRR